MSSSSFTRSDMFISLMGLHGALGQEERHDILRALLDEFVVVVPAVVGEEGQQGGVVLGAPGGVDRLRQGEQVHHGLHEVGRQVLSVLHLRREGGK